MPPRRSAASAAGSPSGSWSGSPPATGYTGDIEALGLWTGEDSETITVTDLWTGAPATRVFHGAGSLLGISGVQHEARLSVRPVRLTLSALSAPVIEAVRLYDPRGARVQIWRRTLSP